MRRPGGDKRSLVMAKFIVPKTRSLPRQRVMTALTPVETNPLVLLTAPAGAGKTTTLAEFANTTQLRAAWYRVERTESEAEVFLQHVEHALLSVGAPLEGAWRDVTDAGSDLGAVAEQPRTVLVLDDLHEVRGTPAEKVLEHLVSYLPPWLGLLAASRQTPAFNLSALRVSNQLVTVDGDVLRWRPWEVERLFRDFYERRLRPEDAARLTQRTEGWAAGLQLFHLASSQLPLSRQSDLIDDLHTRPGLVRDYLARNVLETLPSELRDFLIDTCVLGRLDATICDELRDADDSAEHLADLTARHLFTIRREDGRGYRYHEVLRAHLDATLLERDGPTAAREQYGRGARLLEKHGALAEALHAYARAEEWDDVARLLGEDGPTLASGRGTRALAALPQVMVNEDPWLKLIEARALVGDGSLEEAMAAYRVAEANFAAGTILRQCRRERAAVQAWLDTHDHPIRTPSDVVRAATRREPLTVSRTTERSSAMDCLAAAAAALLAGAAGDALRLAREAQGRDDAEVFTVAAGQALEFVAASLSGRPGGDLLHSAETLEQLGATWLCRIVRAVAAAGTVKGDAENEAMMALADEHGDAWGSAVVALVQGLAQLLRGEGGRGHLSHAIDAFHRLGAAVLECWARSFDALAAALWEDPEPSAAADQARWLARSIGVPGAEAVAELAVAVASDDPEQPLARARLLAEQLELELPELVPPVREPRRATLVAVPTPVHQAKDHIHLLGGLDMVFGGKEVDLQGLRPLAREGLSLLAVHAGSAIHRERILEALWPGEDPDNATKKLQVLVSTVRRHLEPDATAGDWTLLRRRGQSYLLDVSDDVDHDVTAFMHASAAAQEAHRRGDAAAERVHLEDAFGRYRGELLPELGPTEWVLGDRDRLRERHVLVAQRLAETRLESGDTAGSVDACLAGLRSDPYRSRLWTLLAQAHRAAGDEAAALKAEARHEEVLADLEAS